MPESTGYYGDVLYSLRNFTFSSGGHQVGRRTRHLPQLWFVLACLALPASGAVTIVGAGNLRVTVDSDGSYGLSAPETGWEFRGSIGAPLTNLQTGSSADGIGGYTEISFDFQSGVSRHASIRCYSDRRDVMFLVRHG